MKPEIYDAAHQLKALAGWARVRGSCGEATDEHKVALDKLIDGCTSVLGCVLSPDELVIEEPDAVSHPVPRQSVVSKGVFPDAPVHAMPEEVRAVIEEARYVGGGKYHPENTPSSHGACYTADGTEISHKFDMKTQRCIYCGNTYKNILGRDPELMH